MKINTVCELTPIRPVLLKKIADEFPQITWLKGLAPDDRVRNMPEADVVYGLPAPEWLASARKLKWVNVPFAGVTPELCQAAKAAGVVLTNSIGIYNQTIAEHALGLMLALARRWDVYMKQQAQRIYATACEPPMQLLSGSTVGIIGVGNIGQSIARVCKAMGMRVLGTQLPARPTPFVDFVYPPEQLLEMVRQVQWLVSAAPLTPKTERMVNAEVLAALPRGARVINISRGPVIDEPALVDALRSKHIAGAGLDVSTIEPLPEESPLWDLPGVILTPHVAGVTANASTAAAELFLRNLHNYAQDLPLENVVNLDLGY